MVVGAEDAPLPRSRLGVRVWQALFNLGLTGNVF